jgi:hypothetical protein
MELRARTWGGVQFRLGRAEATLRALRAVGAVGAVWGVRPPRLQGQARCAVPSAPSAAALAWRGHPSGAPLRRSSAHAESSRGGWHSGDISHTEFATWFERYEPLMPDAALDVDAWQRTQAADNTLTAVPWDNHVPLIETFQNVAHGPAFPDKAKPSAFEPGSFEQQKEEGNPTPSSDALPAQPTSSGDEAEAAQARRRVVSDSWLVRTLQASPCTFVPLQNCDMYYALHSEIQCHDTAVIERECLQCPRCRRPAWRCSGSTPRVTGRGGPCR